MNPEKINKIESSNTPLDIEKMKQDFESFKNAGISIETYYDLQQKFLDEKLKPYQETYEESEEAKIVIETNDEKLLTNEEIGDFVDSKFQGDILRKGLVTTIEIRFSEVNYQAPKGNSFGIEKGEYYLPKTKFLEYFNKLSPEQQKELTGNIYHAESFASWNRITEQENETVGVALLESGHVLPTPVALFNLEFDDETKAISEGKLEEAGLGYLSETKESERQKMYALGTIAHELAHNIFQHLIYGKPHQKEWEEIVDRLGSITKYAEEYKNDKLTHYDENFAEAIRLFTTTKEFLEKSGHSEMARFVEKYFSEIQ
jgi:hypothetical protein